MQTPNDSAAELVWWVAQLGVQCQNVWHKSGCCQHIEIAESLEGVDMCAQFDMLSLNSESNPTATSINSLALEQYSLNLAAVNTHSNIPIPAPDDCGNISEFEPYFEEMSKMLCTRSNGLPDQVRPWVNSYQICELFVT